MIYQNAPKNGLKPQQKNYYVLQVLLGKVRPLCQNQELEFSLTHENLFFAKEIETWDALSGQRTPRDHFRSYTGFYRKTANGSYLAWSPL